MDRTEFLRALIGKPWVANAKGPDAYDCWHLAAHIERKLFARDLPDVQVPDDPGWRWIIETFRDHPEAARWTLVGDGLHGPSVPDGALVALGHVTQCAHVGVWLAAERRVIHADRGGVRCEDIVILRANGWGRVRFYAPVQC